MNLRMAVAAAAMTLTCGGAAQAANFVSNPGFEAPSGGATSAFFFTVGGQSAAPDWPLYNNLPATTSTEVLSSTAPNGGAQMLHISTGAAANGTYQVFGGLARYASVNVRVLSGTVALYLFTSSGSLLTGSAFSSGGSGWQTLSLDTGSANSNEIVIYSYGGAANFYVDNAYASDAPQPTSGAPEPASWALIIAGFGAAGGILRRRRAERAAA